MLLNLLAVDNEWNDLIAQEKVFPVIEEFGGIYDIPDADIKPSIALEYKIVIDVASGQDQPELLNPALNNVARMLNLFAVGGANMTKVHVVLAVHGGATYALMDNEAYSVRFGVDNANVDLIKALLDEGVKIAVCGQSLISRGVPDNKLVEGVEIATSMLTTVATYQTLGYHAMKF